MMSRAVHQHGMALQWAKGPLWDDFDLEVEALRDLKKRDEKRGILTVYSRKNDPLETWTSRQLYSQQIWDKWSNEGYSPAVPRDWRKYNLRMEVAVGNRIATSESEGMLICFFQEASDVSKHDGRFTVTARVGLSGKLSNFIGLLEETTIEQFADRVLGVNPAAQYLRLFAVHGTSETLVLPENGRRLLVTALAVPPEKNVKDAVRLLSQRTSNKKSRSPSPSEYLRTSTKKSRSPSPSEYLRTLIHRSS